MNGHIISKICISFSAQLPHLFVHHYHLSTTIELLFRHLLHCLPIVQGDGTTLSIAQYLSPYNTYTEVMEYENALVWF